MYVHLNFKALSWVDSLKRYHTAEGHVRPREKVTMKPVTRIWRLRCISLRTSD